MRGGSLQVLLVDDDQCYQEYLAKALARTLGEPPVLAGNGEQAMEILSSWMPDLLITDTNMPGKNGIDLIVWAKKHCPKLVIFSLFDGLAGTALTDKDVLALGAHKVFKKQESAKLLAAVRALLPFTCYGLMMSFSV